MNKQQGQLSRMEVHMEKLYDHETRERIDNDSRINEMIRETRNTNNINPYKYMLNLMENDMQRNYMIIKIAYYNPLLATKAITSIWADTRRLEREVLKIIKRGIDNSLNPNYACST